MNSRQLLAKLDRLYPEMRSEVKRALESLRRKVDVEALVDALYRGDDLAARRLLARLPKAMTPATRVLRKAAELGIRSETVVLMPDAKKLAARAASKSSARLVEGLARDTRKAVRDVIADASRRGLSPRTVAQRIRPMIGLNSRQMKAVEAFRDAQKAKGVSANVANRRVEKYTAQLIKQRAEMIARTELVAASTAGKVEAWTEARRRGVLGHDVMKTWIVTADDRLCPICEPMFGKQVEPHGLFDVNGDMLDGPPAHPNCRCDVRLLPDKTKKSARRAA